MRSPGTAASSVAASTVSATALSSTSQSKHTAPSSSSCSTKDPVPSTTTTGAFCSRDPTSSKQLPPGCAASFQPSCAQQDTSGCMGRQATSSPRCPSRSNTRSGPSSSSTCTGTSAAAALPQPPYPHHPPHPVVDDEVCLEPPLPPRVGVVLPQDHAAVPQPAGWQLRQGARKQAAVALDLGAWGDGGGGTGGHGHGQGRGGSSRLGGRPYHSD